MSLLYVDSFDDRQGATGTAIGVRYPAFSLASSSNAIANSGVTRTGYYLQFTTSAAYVQQTIAAAATVIVGFALFLPALNGNEVVCQLLDSGTAQLKLRINTDGTFSVLDGAGSVLGTTALAYTPNISFVYVELKATINNSTGAVTLKLNGTTALTLTGQDTQTTGNASANQVRLNAGATNLHRFDDWYIANTAGAVNNDFIGQLKVECLFPTGVGNSSGFAATGAATGWQATKDVNPDEDATYSGSAVVGTTDTYTFGNLASSAVTVKGVQIGIRGRKDDALSRAVAPVVRHSGTDYVGTNQTLTNSYVDNAQVYETNPGTGSAWVGTDVDAAEIGVQVTL